MWCGALILLISVTFGSDLKPVRANYDHFKGSTLARHPRAICLVFDCASFEGSSRGLKKKKLWHDFGLARHPNYKILRMDIDNVRLVKIFECSIMWSLVSVFFLRLLFAPPLRSMACKPSNKFSYGGETIREQVIPAFKCDFLSFRSTHLKTLKIYDGYQLLVLQIPVVDCISCRHTSVDM